MKTAPPRKGASEGSPGKGSPGGANAAGEEALRKRLQRISDLFSGMAARAEALARVRCPYRDRFDRCTAKFRCRNQLRAGGLASAAPARHVCTQDGRFDYRSAWESHPGAYEKAKAKIGEVRRRAERRRRGDGGGGG